MSTQYKFVKNADIRAGNIPGWPSKEGRGNGDVNDPNNLARSNAHIIVNDGTVAMNAMTMHAAKIVAFRRVVIITALVLSAAIGFYKLGGMSQSYGGGSYKAPASMPFNFR